MSGPRQTLSYISSGSLTCEKSLDLLIVFLFWYITIKIIMLSLQDPYNDLCVIKGLLSGTQGTSSRSMSTVNALLKIVLIYIFIVSPIVLDLDRRKMILCVLFEYFKNRKNRQWSLL